MLDNLIISFKIMGQGMFGIFVSILLIMLAIFIISKINKKKDDTPSLD